MSTMTSSKLAINMKAVEEHAANNFEPDDRLDSLDNAWRGVADKAANLLARFSTALTSEDALTSTASERSTLLSVVTKFQQQLSQDLEDDCLVPPQPSAPEVSTPNSVLSPVAAFLFSKPTTPNTATTTRTTPNSGRRTSGATRTAAEIASGADAQAPTNTSNPVSPALPQLNLTRHETKSWKRPDHAVYRKAQSIDELYDVDGEIGRGGFSIVRKGRDRQTGQVYALKMVSLRVFRKHQDLIETEVHVLASVNHPKLVGLREIVRTRTHLVLVMEFIKGGELFDLLVDLKAFSEQTAKDVFFQLLEAVDALHQNGIIHRDLKPENILVQHKPDPNDPDPKLDVKLTDFGLAVLFDPAQPNRESAGTVEYSAPEVVNKQPYSFSCDLWSLGVILYIMLTGYPPFYGETEREVMAMVKTGKCDYTPRAWGQVSREARHVVQGLLRKNPVDRFTIAELRNHPWLAEYALGGPTPPVPQRPSLPLSHTSRLLSRFNATRKFRKAVFAVLVTQRFLQRMELMGSTDSEDAQMYPSPLLAHLRQSSKAGRPPPYPKQKPANQPLPKQGSFSAPKSKSPEVVKKISPRATNNPNTNSPAQQQRRPSFTAPVPRPPTNGKSQPVASTNNNNNSNGASSKAASPTAVAAALLASCPSVSSLGSSNQSKATFANQVPVDTAAAKAAMQRHVSWRLPDHAVLRRVKRIEELYDVREKLGEGAFSTVHRGICRQTHKEFALKVIRYRVFKLHQELMENEIEILAGVCHPRLVGMHELVRTETQYIIVAELVRGGELFDHIVKLKKLSEDVARTVMHQLLEAVEVLHLHGIVHRDLKPENILLANESALSSHTDISLKLADFGLSVFYDPNSSIAGAGTPEYSAPEVIRSDHHDFSCDIWSIGVILYIMLCGFPPFTGTSSAEVMRKVKIGSLGFPAPHWIAISPEAKDLVTQLLQKNPLHRPTINQIREHPWMARFHTDNDSAPHLPQAIDALRKFNATKHLRKAVFAALVVSKFCSMSPELGKRQGSAPAPRVGTVKQSPTALRRKGTYPTGTKNGSPPLTLLAALTRRSSLTSPSNTANANPVTKPPPSMLPQRSPPQPRRQEQQQQQQQSIASQTKQRFQLTNKPRGPVFVTPLA